MIKRRDIPGNKVQYLRLLREFRKTETDAKALEAIITQDLSLSYRLLKYINSPLFGLRAEIRSVRHALTLLGERDVRRWATLVVLSGVAPEKPPALLESGLLRARFCESLAGIHERGARDTAEQMFLVGLFSVLDALLDMPLEEALGEAGVPSRVKDTILGGPSPWRNSFELVLAYERRDWEKVTQCLDSLGLDVAAVSKAFVDSVDWAHQASESTVDGRWSSGPPPTNAQP